MVLGLEMETLLFRYPIRSNHRQRDQVSMQAMEHYHHEKRHVVETFLAEHSLMPLLYGLLPYLRETILKSSMIM
jgi:hypothetical protein